WSSFPTVSNSTTVGSATWHDTLDPTTADSDDNQGSSGNARSASITLPSGSITKLRFYIGSVTPPTNGFKVALYDGSNHLLANVTTTAISATGWRVVDIPRTTVASGTYKVAWSALVNGSAIKYRYKNGTGQTDISPITYADFPTDPLVNPTSHVNGVDAVGV